MRRLFLFLLLLAAAGALAYGIVMRLGELERGAGAPAGERAPVPVEVGPVERGGITLRRTFSGALEAGAEFVVAPKVGGRIERVDVDIGDVVERGQVVAHLDDDEFEQALRQAEADLAVARATRAEARSALEIAARELQRLEKLRRDGVTSEAQLDAALSGEVAARATLEVAEANVSRAEASLEAARIRLSYSTVTADWTGGDDRRTVAERWVDEGGTVTANAELMSIVDLDPIVAVVFAPERDYARLVVGQAASLTTDAFPGRRFTGRIARIAPVFRRSTRQARVELAIENRSQELKPGMFVRATIELERLEDVVVVPFEALTERDDQVGVFVLDDARERVAWRPVEPGVRDGRRVQVVGEGLAAFVVTLGQELCDDGARVTVAAGLPDPGGLDEAEREEPLQRPLDEPPAEGSQ